MVKVDLAATHPPEPNNPFAACSLRLICLYAHHAGLKILETVPSKIALPIMDCLLEKGIISAQNGLHPIGNGANQRFQLPQKILIFHHGFVNFPFTIPRNVKALQLTEQRNRLLPLHGYN